MQENSPFTSPMSYDSFIITKRDGTTEPFSLDKIKSAILKTFASTGDPLNAEQLKAITDHLRFCNGMSVRTYRTKWRWH